MTSYNGDEGDAVVPVSHMPYIADPSASLGRPANSVQLQRSDYSRATEYKGHATYSGSGLSFGQPLLPRQTSDGDVEYFPHDKFPLTTDDFDEFDTYSAPNKEIVQRNNAGGLSLAHRLRQGMPVSLRWPSLRHDPVSNFVSLRLQASVDHFNLESLLKRMSGQRGRKAVEVSIPASVWRSQFASMGTMSSGFHFLVHRILLASYCTKGWYWGGLEVQLSSRIPGTQNFRQWCMTNTCTKDQAHCGPTLLPDTSCSKDKRMVYIGDVVASRQKAFRNWLPIDLVKALTDLDKTIDNEVCTFRLPSPNVTTAPNEIIHMILEHWDTAVQLAHECIESGQCQALDNVSLVQETDTGEIIVCLPAATVQAMYKEHKANMNKNHLLMSLDDVKVTFRPLSNEAWTRAREDRDRREKLGPLHRDGPPMNLMAEFVVEGSVLCRGKNPYME